MWQENRQSLKVKELKKIKIRLNKINREIMKNTKFLKLFKLNGTAMPKNLKMRKSH